MGALLGADPVLVLVPFFGGGAPLHRRGRGGRDGGRELEGGMELWEGNGKKVRTEGGVLGEIGVRFGEVSRDGWIGR